MGFKIELVDCNGRAVAQRVWHDEPKQVAPTSNSTIHSTKRKRLDDNEDHLLRRSVKCGQRGGYQIRVDTATLMRTPAPSSRSTPESAIYSPSNSDYSYMRYSAALASPPRFAEEDHGQRPLSPLSDTSAESKSSDNLLYDNQDFALRLSEYFESLADPFTLISG